MLSPQTKSEILAKYLENKISINSLAREYGVNRNTISSILREADVTTTYFVDLPEDEIIDLYINQRLSKEAVAAKFGVSITPIKKIILRRGYSIRDASEAHKGQVAWNKGKEWNQSTKAKIAAKASLRTGDRNPNWRGGNTPKYDKRRNSRLVKEWRSYCLKRDRECLQCGSTERLEVNHIVPIRQIVDIALLGDTENGITLCRKCHQKAYRKEHEFKDIFLNLLKKSRELRENPAESKDTQGQS